MKKYSILLFAAMAVAACSKEGVDEAKYVPVQPVVSNLELRAAFEGEQTRLTTDDGLTFSLEENTETLGVYIETEGTAPIENRKFTAGAAYENGWVPFTPESGVVVQSTSKIYAYAPYKATEVEFQGKVDDSAADNTTRAAWDGTRIVNLPSQQQQTQAGNAAHLADYYTIVATPATPAITEEPDKFSVDLQFSGVFATVKFVLRNDESEAITVSKLVLSSEQTPLSGNFAVDLREENPKLANAAYVPQPVEGKTENSVTVSLATPVVLNNAEQAELYAVVNAGAIAAGKIEVYASMNGTEMLFTKQLTDKNIVREQRAAFGVPLKDGVVRSDKPAYDEAAKTYTITNVSELKWVAEQTNAGNTFSGETLVLAADIDLNNMDWTPIGADKTKSFKGTFDGGSYTISNLSVNTPDKPFAGLFGRIETPGLLKNITIQNAEVTGLSQTGAVVGSAYTGRVESCSVKGDIHITGNYQVGGITGYGYATFADCSVIGNEGSYVKGIHKEDNLEGDAVGGIVGYAAEKNDATATIIGNCEAQIDVTGCRKVGGIAGQCGKDANIDNCRYTGNVATNASEEYIAANSGKIMVGGIAGELTGSELFIKNCTVASGSTVTGIDRNTTGLVIGGSRTAGHQLTEENNTTDGAILIVPIAPWEGDAAEPAYDETNKVYTIYEAAELAWVAEQTKAGRDFSGETVVLGSDIDLNNINWTPIGTDKAFHGTFDGAEHTISNLTVVGTDVAGLFGTAIGTVKNVTVSNVDVRGNFKAAALVADGLCSRIENCHVDGGTIVSTPRLNSKGMYDDANNVGGIVGYLSAEPEAYVKGCSVKNLTITAYRDLGSIVGKGSAGAYEISGNTAENVTVVCEQNVDNYDGAPRDPNAGEIIGRNMSDTSIVENNTAVNVKVVLYIKPAYDATTKTYTVKSAAELAWVAKQTNSGKNFSGETVALNGDIDLNNEPWTPIGTETNAFAGTFDGAGHTVSNLSVDMADSQFVGLFGRSVSPAVLKNVTVNNAAVKGLARAGGIVGSAYTGRVENCHVKGSIKIDSNYQAGGITGYGYASITGCTVIGDAGSYVTSTFKIFRTYEGDSAGGIIGYAGEESSLTNAVISNCKVRIDVIGDRKVGGIVGQAGENANVDNCTYEGNLSLNTSSTTSMLYKKYLYIGGIVGELTGSTLFIKNCTVESVSTITGKNADCTGKLIGGSRTSGYQLTNENNNYESATLTIK